MIATNQNLIVMDEFTKSSTSRILLFVQQFMMDFNDYSIWNYSRKKYNDKASTRNMIGLSLSKLESLGYIQKVRRPGYFKLTEKGQSFKSWDSENIPPTYQEAVKTEKKSWKSWLIPS